MYVHVLQAICAVCMERFVYIYYIMYIGLLVFHCYQLHLSHTLFLSIVFINPKLRRVELDSSSATKFNIDCSKIFRSNKHHLTVQAEAQD